MSLSARSRVLGWLPSLVVAVDLTLMLTLAAHIYSGREIVNNAIDIWFDRSDPTVEVLNQERALFGSDTWMVATIWMRADRLNEGGSVSRALTEQLEQLEGVTRVISPTSLEVLQRSEQGLFFGSLDAAEWPALRETLVRHPFAGEFLVYSKSPELFSLLIKEHTGPTTPGVVRQHLVSEVRRILDSHPAVAASALTGTAVINADLNRLSWGDFLLLVPLTVVVASLMLLAMLRFRWRTTIAILAPVGLTTGSLIALMLLAGRPFTMVTIVLPGLFFTLGIASSVHVTSWTASWLREGHGSPGEVVHATWRELSRPILVSHVTTALGFGLLAVIPVTPVQEMALFGAAGELYSGLHVMFVLPKCLLWFGAASEFRDRRPLFVGERWAADAFAALAAWLTRLQRFRFRLILPMVAACAAMAWLISMVSYDSTYLTMIQPAERLRVDYARFDAAALPSAQLSIVIRRKDPAIVDARLNAALMSVTAEIEALPEVSKVVGPASVFSEVAPALADGTSVEQFGADDAAVADAYAFALSGGNTEIGSYVHDSLGAYRLVVFFPYLDNSRLDRLTRQEIPAILDGHLAPISDLSTEISGVTVLWAHMDDAMSRGQVTSVLIMSVACFVTFFLSLRNWTLSASAMFVNVLPVAIIAALLGAMGRPIDMATVFIMGITLGIAVDDTAFFVHGYLDRAGLADGALAATLRHTGPTMVATCVVIVIGFSVLLVSAFTPMRTFGGLTAVGLVLAMLCDIFILSFLLLAVSGKPKGLHHAENTVARGGAMAAHGGSIP